MKIDTPKTFSKLQDSDGGQVKTLDQEDDLSTKLANSRTLLMTNRIEDLQKKARIIQL